MIACGVWTPKPRRGWGGVVASSEKMLWGRRRAKTPPPPIWVGGESGPALRRTARIGDGWYPIGTNPQHRLDSLKRYLARVELLRRFTREARRGTSKRALAQRGSFLGKSVPGRAGAGEPALVSGGEGV